jgi:uncharacterized protein YndB with AHSA1/START domain
MPDILHDFPIAAPPARVFDAVSAPAALDAWWTVRSSGRPALGETYQLGFGPAYDWRWLVTRCTAGAEFELEITEADRDWRGTRVGFRLEGLDGGTQVRFHHVGWPASNEHYRVSCCCWAMYLRLLRRHVELGEVVPYERRLDV